MLLSKELQLDRLPLKSWRLPTLELRELPWKLHNSCVGKNHRKQYILLRTCKGQVVNLSILIIVQNTVLLALALTA